VTDERTVTVGSKGEVVIPKAIREQIGIRPGQRVRVERVGDEVRVRHVHSLDELEGIFAAKPGGIADVEQEHRRELAREERRARAAGT
jgi:AbrB family looped-hinge helix DNA binding protein